MKATITSFGIQTGTDRTLYAVWSWSKTDTEEYKVKWTYATGDGVGFIGSETTTKNKQHLWTAPANATKVSIVVQPVAKKKKDKNGKETTPWTAEWSTKKTHTFVEAPKKPPTPTVKVEKYKLTAELSNLDVDATSIEFQVVKDDSKVYKTGTATIKTTAASFSCTVATGSEYKVRCRSVKGDDKSEWSDYSDNHITVPAAVPGFEYIKALSETAVQIDWKNVSNVDSYVVEYTTQLKYFDSGGSEVSSVTVDSAAHAEITGLESGTKYHFRVKAVNTAGESGWSDTISIILGKAPDAPTTWSSTTTVISGETLNLYWVHNTEDGSSQVKAELELIIDGEKTVKTITNSTKEDEKDKTSKYSIDTSDYSEGAKIKWRVRTCGITGKYGDWSTQRTVTVYAPPVLYLSIEKDGESIDTLTEFPFYVYAFSEPETQKPIGYHVSIVTKVSYYGEDALGNKTVVKKGQEIYSQYFDTNERDFNLYIEPSDVDLINNGKYTLKCMVAMNSGLTATASQSFTVKWKDVAYYPNAELSYDPEKYIMDIMPYCEDADGDLVENVTLSVYRREFDGTFVEIATGIDNLRGTSVVDPHPSLDYARYRIVTTDINTGNVTHYDMPGYPIDEKGVIIQWDEAWTQFDALGDDPLEEPAWAGSLLRLPYNIDVTPKYAPDVAMVAYAGRKHPVSYYGTHLGESASWKVEIEKDDINTLYALRRLAIYMGDVYVREPSGSGYWANINVSFSQTHSQLTIPVTLDITRVEGGM